MDYHQGALSQARMRWNGERLPHAHLARRSRPSIQSQSTWPASRTKLVLQIDDLVQRRSCASLAVILRIQPTAKSSLAPHPDRPHRSDRRLPSAQPGFLANDKLQCANQVGFAGWRSCLQNPDTQFLGCQSAVLSDRVQPFVEILEAGLVKPIKHR